MLDPSGSIFGCPHAFIRCPRPVPSVFLAKKARVGFAPDHTDTENADGRTLAAIAATYGIAKSKEINQVFGLQTRGT